MKVADIMQSQVDFVAPDAPVKEVARFIFGHGINGLPVCDEKKVIGFITERDILTKFYPSMHEYLEDPIHEGDFEAMEEKAAEILELSAKDIMSKNPMTITPDSPVLHAQSRMAVYKVGRLPVVNRKGELIGIISKGDIFNAVVGRRMALEQEEEFYDWLGRYYDVLYDWPRRLSYEIPDLTALFKKQKVRSILDVGSGNGQHAIALAEAGFEVAGVEASSLMQDRALLHKKSLPNEVQKRIKFIKGTYENALKEVKTQFDSAIFMGNALPYEMLTDKEILSGVANTLPSKNATMVFQIINFDKFFERKNGLREFVLTGREKMVSQHLLLGFYTKENSDFLQYTHSVFNFIGNRWQFLGLKSTSLLHIGQQRITELLQKVGFSNISYFGSSLYGPLFEHKFRPTQSDWLIVVAKRK